MSHQELSPSVSAFEELRTYALSQGLITEWVIRIAAAALHDDASNRALDSEDLQHFKNELRTSENSRKLVAEISKSLSISEDEVLCAVITLMSRYAELTVRAEQAVWSALPD